MRALGANGGRRGIIEERHVVADGYDDRLGESRERPILERRVEDIDERRAQVPHGRAAIDGLHQSGELRSRVVDQVFGVGIARERGEERRERWIVRPDQVRRGRKMGRRFGRIVLRVLDRLALHEERALHHLPDHLKSLLARNVAGRVMSLTVPKISRGRD